MSSPTHDNRGRALHSPGGVVRTAAKVHGPHSDFFEGFWIIEVFFSVFFFSRFLSESSEILRMLPYDCMNLAWSLAEIIADTFFLLPIARIRHLQSAGSTSPP